MSNVVKVWTKFTKKYNDNLVRFRIQELQDDDFEQMLGVLFDFLIPESPLYTSVDFINQKKAVEEYRQCYRNLSKALNYQIDVCCLVDESEKKKIVGVSVMVPLKKDGEQKKFDEINSMFESYEIKKMFGVSQSLSKTCNVFEQFGVDFCYKGKGLVVHQDYRRLGIAGELLKARMVICKERGVPLTLAWMSTVGVQKAAAKLGWVTANEILFKDISEMCGVDMKASSVNSCKLMAIKL